MKRKPGFILKGSQGRIGNVRDDSKEKRGQNQLAGPRKGKKKKNRKVQQFGNWEWSQAFLPKLCPRAAKPNSSWGLGESGRNGGWGLRGGRKKLPETRTDGWKGSIERKVCLAKVKSGLMEGHNGVACVCLRIFVGEATQAKKRLDKNAWGAGNEGEFPKDLAREFRNLAV